MSMIVRYTASQRLNHLAVALLFILAALSGLAFFYPPLFFLTDLFGGGETARMLHPFIGAAMFAFFFILFLRFAHHNILHRNDRQWLMQIGDVLSNHEERVPEPGRYNGGQKLLFWVMVLCMFALFLSGLAFWRPYFTSYFDVDVRRMAAVVHAVSAWILILGIIVHVYAAIWVKGTLGAMSTGKVSSAWAKKHHPGWYKEVSGK